MSCFIVDTKTIDRILTAVNRHLSDPNCRHLVPKVLEARTERCSADRDPYGGYARLGRAMLNLNTYAYNYRYSRRERPEEPPYYGCWNQAFVSDVQSYKSLQCFLYQCAEGDADERPLYQELLTYSRRFAHHLIDQWSQYDLAEWG